MKKMKLVMVGNGMAGVRTLEELLRLAPDLYEITVFGAEPHPNYNRILLSPVLAGEQTLDEIVLNPLSWYRDHGITLHTGQKVVHVDRQRRLVTTADGIEAEYDRLLLATGSNPFIPPLPGRNLEGVIAYRDLARARRQVLRINLEIDVGLHRGGLPDDASLREVIGLLQGEPWLQWSGLMGYDAHTEKIPDLGGLRTAARAQVQQRYRACLDAMQASPLARDPARLTLNTGGSPTYRLHQAGGAANEVALGSALVKPSDFDTPLLADLQPAVWIATPVLKVAPWRAPDGVGALGTLLRGWDPNQRVAHFIHGGHWLAQPDSPAGLQASALIGASSNQQLYVGSGRQGLQPDDLVFFRPTQSEAVLQQFGDMAVVEGERVVAMWPVFPARA